VWPSAGRALVAGFGSAPPVDHACAAGRAMATGATCICGIGRAEDWEATGEQNCHEQVPHVSSMGWAAPRTDRWRRGRAWPRIRNSACRHRRRALPGCAQRPPPSLLGFWFLADWISRREYALVQRAGLSNQAGPVEFGSRYKSYNFTH